MTPVGAFIAEQLQVSWDTASGPLTALGFGWHPPMERVLVRTKYDPHRRVLVAYARNRTQHRAINLPIEDLEALPTGEAVKRRVMQACRDCMTALDRCTEHDDCLASDALARACLLSRGPLRDMHTHAPWGDS
jgi:hypothetical protein